MEIVPGIYRHFKGGVYRVVGLARHSETEEPHVVYLAGDGRLWIRPVAMFLENVEREDYSGPRFILVKDEMGIDGSPDFKFFPEEFLQDPED